MRIQRVRGFTLVELLVGLAIFSIIGLILVHQLILGSRHNTEQNAIAKAQQSMRAARQLISQDIRLAGLDPRRTFRFGFEEATGSKFRVTADFDSDGVVDDSGAERVTYQIRAANRDLQKILYEGQGAGIEVSAPLLNRIDPANSSFAYLNAAGVDLGNPVPAASLGNIRTVVVTLTVEESAGQSGTVTRESSGQVKCRNLDM
ncbi:MAG: prepilin-type N-terminal cleavage/methylation domain-containing protein [Desulfosarcinaceae bacterium]